MAKQIITLEIEFDPTRSSAGCYPFRAWLAKSLMKHSKWITNVLILSISPVHYQGDEDPDELRPKLVDHPSGEIWDA